MRFRLIEDHRLIWPVRVMCDALSASPSGYYLWRSRPESPRKIANRELLGDIQRIHAHHRGRYGAPRIHAELRAEGQAVSRKRIERQHGISGGRERGGLAPPFLRKQRTPLAWRLTGLGGSSLSRTGLSVRAATEGPASRSSSRW